MVLPQSTDIEHQWTQVRGMLRAEVGDTAYSTWLKPLDREEQTLCWFQAPPRFHRQPVSNIAR